MKSERIIRRPVWAPGTRKETDAMRPDVEDFYNGISFDCFRLLGAHPAAEGWRFTVWAPHAMRVQVLGDWNGWNLYRPDELCFCEDGLWRGTAPAARHGQCYKYNILCADGVWRLRADPFAAAFESLPGTGCLLTEPTEPVSALRRPWYSGPVSIYELHAGSWRRHWDGRYYTGPELAETLIPWLLAHHYTHVEFLPLAEHPFDGSWGYQGVGYFSVTARIGGLAGFTALTKALHAAGIGVLMDFVPVHFAPDEGFLSNFDGTPLFESGASDWGSLNFNLASPPVRSFLLSAAAFWLQVCGCDGLRVDAVGNALYRDLAGGGAAAEFFQTLTAGLHARFPGALLAAEDTAGLLNATSPTEWGGLGFDFVWDPGWSYDALALFCAPPAARGAAALRLHHGLDTCWHARRINALSHDDCADHGGGLTARLWGDASAKRAQMRLLTLLQAARPGGMLRFMGVDMGVWRPFSPWRELDWGILADPEHLSLSKYSAALGAFYAEHPALWDGGDERERFAWARRDTVFGWVRYGDTEALLCAFNPLPEPQSARFDLCGYRRAVPLFTTGFEAHPCGGEMYLPGFAGAVYRLER